MVGRLRPLAGPAFRIPLLAGLTARQQATPRSVPVNLSNPGVSTMCRGLSAGKAPHLPGALSDTIFQAGGFSRAKVASTSLQAPTPLLYEAHRRNIASI